MTTESRFAFGKNWQQFLEKHFSEDAVEAARNHFLDMLGIESLEGKRFVDIGSGSGIHSLVAHRLAAREVVSFDYDPQSVAATRQIWEYSGRPDNWTVVQGSILDQGFIDGLGMFDLVYSWGVLHHTGAMWDALRNVCAMVNPSGYIYIALYNKDRSKQGSHYWLKRKKFYVEHGPLIRRFLFYEYLWRKNIFPKICSLKNPFKFKTKRRGMSYFSDVIDWIGGYPYEFANAGEVFSLITEEFDMNLRNLRTPGGLNNNEFIFVRNGVLL
jgi:SAM-dependent methyltransferase